MATDFLENKFDMERALRLSYKQKYFKGKLEKPSVLGIEQHPTMFLFDDIEVRAVPVLLRTLAVLADAHDEAFLLTRVCDQEHFKPEQLLIAIKRFHDLN